MKITEFQLKKLIKSIINEQNLNGSSFYIEIDGRDLLSDKDSVKKLSDAGVKVTASDPSLDRNTTLLWFDRSKGWSSGDKEALLKSVGKIINSQITESQLKQVIEKLIIEQKLQGFIDKINPFKQKKEELSQDESEMLKNFFKDFKDIKKFKFNNLMEVSKYFEEKYTFWIEKQNINDIAKFDSKSIVMITESLFGIRVIYSIDAVIKSLFPLEKYNNKDLKYSTISLIYGNASLAAVSFLKILKKLKNQEAIEIAETFISTMMEKEDFAKQKSKQFLNKR